jgi:hypothetical protein
VKHQSWSLIGDAWLRGFPGGSYHSRQSHRPLNAIASSKPHRQYSHAAVEVHSVDTNRGVVLDSQINVFANTESEIASLAEVALPQLVFLDLEATLENLLCLWTADCDVDGDFLVTTDTERADGVAGFACREVWLSRCLN